MNPSAPTFRSLLLRCARVLSDEINVILEPHQLNYSLWQVLYVIHHQHCCTSIQIAHYLNVSKPSIAKRVQALLQLDILLTMQSEDKRQKVLRLSPHGEQLFQTCSFMIQQLESKLLQSLPQDQIESAKQVLITLTQQLHQHKMEVL